MFNSEVVEVAVTDHVARIIITREKALNALNTQVLTDLSAILEQLYESAVGNTPYEKCRVVTISGQGEKAFVAGADIKLMQDGSGEQVREFIKLGQSVMRKIEELPLPVIAAVDGFAIGGGMELALACDLIVATDRSKLGQAEVNLGIIPGFGGTQRLLRRAGHGAAKRLILTGETIGAQEAYRLGIVDWLVSPTELTEQVDQVCKTLKSKGPLAIAASKRAMLNAYEMAASEALEAEVEEFLGTHASADGREGLVAFVEKRAAQFKGI